MTKKYIFVRTFTGLLVAIVVYQNIEVSLHYPDHEDRSLLGFAGQYHISDSDTSASSALVLSIVPMG